MKRRGACVFFLLALVTRSAASNTDDYNEAKSDVTQPDGENIICAICLESLFDFEEKPVTRRDYFQCNNHQYHQECVNEMDSSEPCPECRASRNTGYTRDYPINAHSISALRQALENDKATLQQLENDKQWIFLHSPRNNEQLLRGNAQPTLQGSNDAQETLQVIEEFNAKAKAAINSSVRNTESVMFYYRRQRYDVRPQEPLSEEELLQQEQLYQTINNYYVNLLRIIDSEENIQLGYDLPQVVLVLQEEKNLYDSLLERRRQLQKWIEDGQTEFEASLGFTNSRIDSLTREQMNLKRFAHSQSLNDIQVTIESKERTLKKLQRQWSFTPKTRFAAQRIKGLLKKELDELTKKFSIELGNNIIAQTSSDIMTITNEEKGAYFNAMTKNVLRLFPPEENAVINSNFKELKKLKKGLARNLPNERVVNNAIANLDKLKDPPVLRLMVTLARNFGVYGAFKLREKLNLLVRKTKLGRYNARIQYFQVIRKVEFEFRRKVFRMARDPVSFEEVITVLERQLIITEEHEKALEAEGMSFQEKFLVLIGGRRQYQPLKPYEPVVKSRSIKKMIEVFNFDFGRHDDRRQVFLNALMNEMAYYY